MTKGVELFKRLELRVEAKDSISISSAFLKRSMTKVMKVVRKEEPGDESSTKDKANDSKLHYKL